MPQEPSDDDDLPSTTSSGAWRAGDPVGGRQFLDLGAVELERGGVLPGVRLAYETWGELNAAGDNAILVEHALTGDSHVVGEAGPGHPTPGWWDGLIGPGRGLDTDRYFVVAANVLGGCQGSTGPSSTGPGGTPWGSRFPFITVRDQVQTEALLADALGIARWRLVLGGSMGGMRALEWAVTHPARVQTALVLASTAYATAEQIGWCQAQLLALRGDPHFRGGDYYDAETGPDAGLGDRPADRARDLPQRARAARALRPAQPGRRGPAGWWWAVRRRVLPRPPCRQAGRPLRRQLLRRPDRGDERARRRPRARGRACCTEPGHR